ncbi:MAG: hypothetical protein ACO1OQ_05685 [Rufibacter sp.]
MTATAQNKKMLFGAFSPKKADVSFVNEYFLFEKATFKLRTLHCTGEEYGEGTYQITSDSLKLYFNELKRPTTPSFKLLSFTEHASDSMFFQINVVDDSGETLPGANVSYASAEKWVGTTTGLDGKALVSFSKGKMPPSLRIQFIGFSPVEIPINDQWPNASNVQVSLPLKDMYYYSAGETKSYKIQRLGSKSFTLQLADDYFVTYKRGNIKKFDKIINPGNP